MLGGLTIGTRVCVLVCVLKERLHAGYGSGMETARFPYVPLFLSICQSGILPKLKCYCWGIPAICTYLTGV